MQSINLVALSANEREAARLLEICNACRYCEGFCAVFPAMTRRLSFAKADVHFLANLCHNCGACWRMRRPRCCNRHRARPRGT